MPRLLATALTIALVLATATSAPAAVNQDRDSQRHEVHTDHNFNICGDLATFTFDVTWRFHAVDNGTTLAGTYTETFRYSLVFDDPSLGTWTGHGTETVQLAENHSGTVFHDIFNSREGPVQIIEHLQFHTDADGNVTLDRTFERHVGC
jgi:hypothetical protein